jgi:hypothetical protein
VFFEGMNTECPYCGCRYKIDDEQLQNPEKDASLGYGWWLRCYKCGKRWWLGSVQQKLSMPLPPRADKEANIAKLSTLLGKKRPAPKKPFLRHISLYVVMMLLAVGALMIYQNMASIKSYLMQKALHISESAAKKIVMTDIRYFMEPGDNKITVTGNVANEDKIVIAVNGIKVVIFDEDTEVISWRHELESKSLSPNQKVEFLTEKQLHKVMTNPRVEVSLF